MKNEDLLTKIQSSYRNCEYKNALVLIDEYLSLEELDDSKSVMKIYIKSLIRVNKKEEAFNLLIKSARIWPELFQIYSFFELIILCDRPDYLETILKLQEFPPDYYYIVARKYLLCGYYELSMKWFKYCIDNTKNQELICKSKSFLNELENYYNKGEFVQMDYYKYRSLNNTLRSGDMVYLNSHCNKEFSARPLVIWKIENGKIYGFQITISDKYKKNYNYILKKDHYRNFREDKCVKNDLCTFEEREIEKIIGRVNDYDFEKIVERNYKSCCFKKVSGLNKMFYDDVFDTLNIGVNDLICSYDDNGNLNIYYVIRVEDGKYLCVSVIDDNGFFYLDSNDYYILTREDYIMKYTFSNYKREIKNVQYQLNKQLRKGM